MYVPTGKTVPETILPTSAAVKNVVVFADVFAPSVYALPVVAPSVIVRRVDVLIGVVVERITEAGAFDRVATPVAETATMTVALAGIAAPLAPAVIVVPTSAC